MEEHRKLYGNLKELFKDHDDLLSDYAGFLPLDQAVALGCFISSLEFEKARIFMTKLEVCSTRARYYFMFRCLPLS